MAVHAAEDDGCNLIRQHLERYREIMLAVWQSPGSSAQAARRTCYSAAMDLREKAFAGLQPQHPTRHLSVHRLCLKPVGRREKRGKDRAGCNCSGPVSRDTQSKSFPSRRGRRQSAKDAPRTRRFKGRGGSWHSLHDDASIHRRSQTYVAGILKVGGVDCPLEDGLAKECRWAVEV